jgi:hypothetical protein
MSAYVPLARSVREAMLRFLRRKIKPIQKMAVPLLGTFGIVLATSPAFLFLPSPLTIFPLPILISIAWAPLAGWPVTSAWSKALHKRAEVLKNSVDFEHGVKRDVQESEAGRVDWIPGWIGFFERA